MGFLAVGINHKTASVDVRERVAFAPDQLADALQQLRDETAAREVAILSTCNRTEIYCTQDQARPEQLIEWVARYHGLNPEDVARCSYVHQEAGAVSHMMRGPAGLDALVLRAPPCGGQGTAAWPPARSPGTRGPPLDRLFQSPFNTAEQVRTDTAIGANPGSAAPAAVTLARQIFADLGRSTAL